MSTALAGSTCRPHAAAATTARQQQPSTATRASIISRPALGLRLRAAPRACAVRASRSGHAVVLAAAEAIIQGVELSKVAVPAHLPRDDLADQLMCMAINEAEANPVRTFGMKYSVDAVYRGDSLWGFDVTFVREGAAAAKLRCSFDEEVFEKHQWLGRGADQMPEWAGDVTEIMGKHFVIAKICDNKADAEVKATLRAFCGKLATHVNNYYAFGSVYAEDI